ncbi:MAG: LytTR family DNA-binding domain-containing protein [Parasphingorhabdus sp.]
MEHNFPKQLAVELLVITGIGVIFGLLGPFGTYAMPTVWRLSYWIIFIIIGYAIFRPISFVAGWLSDFGTIPFPLSIALALLVAGLPLAIMIGFMINGFNWNGPMLGDGFALLYVQVVGIGVGIFLLMHHLFRKEEPAIKQLVGAADIADIRPAIMDRLPAGFPRDILALSVEDHYVRVYTADRSEMILMRLADAINEVAGLDGAQVHRSYWVAKHAIASTKRDGRNLRLILSNGLEIPVSRSNVGMLKQTGWI